MSTDTDTPKQNKYLDHCICNEHEEKKILDLHSAVKMILVVYIYIKCPVEYGGGWGVQLLFGQCPNVERANLKGPSLIG